MNALNNNTKNYSGKKKYNKKKKKRAEYAFSFEFWIKCNWNNGLSMTFGNGYQVYYDIKLSKLL